MSATSLYLRPDENFCRAATVTTTAGATDTDYTDDWLVDQLVGRPVKATNGTAGWTITAAAGSINGVAICNHNIDGARTITLSGVSFSLSAPAARPNGIPYNAWAYDGTVATGVTALGVSVASNSVSLVIGEVGAGVFREFPGGGVLANELSATNTKRVAGQGAASVRPYDSGEAARSWQSNVLAHLNELDDMMAWFEAQKNGTLPSYFVPDSTKNDVWAVELLEPTWTYLGTRYRVTLNFREYERRRW